MNCSQLLASVRSDFEEGCKNIANETGEKMCNERARKERGIKKKKPNQQLNLKCCPQDERFLLLMEK